VNTGQQLKETLSLAVVSLVSALLTLFAIRVNGGFWFVFWGGIFGLVISVYLALTDASRRFWAAARFIVVCCGAFYSAFVVTFWVALNLDRGSASQNPNESPVAFLVGGSLGAFLVLSEALFLLHPEVPWKLSLLRGLCWSPAGGVLGAIGAFLGVADWHGRTDRIPCCPASQRTQQARTAARGCKDDRCPFRTQASYCLYDFLRAVCGSVLILCVSGYFRAACRGSAATADYCGDGERTVRDKSAAIGPCPCRAGISATRDSGRRSRTSILAAYGFSLFEWAADI
jgi:hypothetical protein